MKKFLDCISVVGSTPSRFQGTKKYVSTGAVATTEIDESEVVEVSYEDRPSRANLTAEAGDILFAKMQGTRKTLLLDSETEENIYSTGFYAVRANPEIITTECLYYLVDSELFLAQKDKNCSGATQKAITNGGLAKIEIRIPPLSEQAVLTEKLRYLTQLIADRKKQLELFDEVIKSRFIEMFGDPITNSKCLPTNDLGKVLLLKAGDFTAASDIAAEPTTENTYPCYGGNGIRGYVAEYNQEGTYSLIGRQGALSGNVQYATGKFKNTEHALLVTPLIEMNSVWLNHLLINLDLQRYQTGAAQPGLSVKNLQEIPIIEVPKEEQNQFAAFVEQTDKSKYHGEFTYETEVAA